MTAPTEAAAGRGSQDLAWTQLLLDVLQEGRKTATYKLAVLLALIDSCVIGTDATGRPPDVISTRDLAERVLEIYWRQVRSYPRGAGGDVVLRQSTQPRAVTVHAVRELHVMAAEKRATTPAAAKVALPDEYERALDEVELNLVQMPLGKLQRPHTYVEGNPDYLRFLYDDSAFSERVTRRQLRQAPLSVHLRPGVADRLVSLAGLLRPLLELHWTRAVAKLNGEEFGSDRLHDFLFGAQREQLGPVRQGLVELQSGICFYCRRRLEVAAVQVDHFVPWSRMPNDGLTNLVASDPGCNNSKRDHYADLGLVQRWAARPDDQLRALAEDLRWPLRRPESLGIARGLYAHLPAGTHLWQARGVFALLDRDQLDDVLPSLLPS